MGNNDNLYATIAVVAILAFAAAIIVTAIVAYRGALSPSTSSALQKSTVTVTATGSVSATPSQSAVYITVNGTAASAASATAMLSNTLYSLSSTLAPYLSNSTSDIQTVSYQLYRPYNSTMYTASEGLIVLLPLNTTGSAVTALSAVNNTYITGITIQLSQSQIRSLGPTALAIAMQNATTQAQLVAGPHVPLTISSVSINGNVYVYPGTRLALGANVVPIFTGTQSATQSITVVFTYT